MTDNIIELCDNFLSMKAENERLQSENALLTAELQRLRNTRACDSCGFLTGEFRK